LNRYTFVGVKPTPLGHLLPQVLATCKITKSLNFTELHRYIYPSATYKGSLSKLNLDVKKRVRGTFSTIHILSY